MPARRRPAGVTLETFTGRYVASLPIEGRSKKLGRWTKRRDAELAVDRALLYLKLDRPLHHPKMRARLVPTSPDDLQAEAKAKLKEGRSSQYNGVYRQKGQNERWAAKICHNYRTLAVQGFLSERAAADAYDRMVLYYRGASASRNFPEKRLEPVSHAALKKEQFQERKTNLEYHVHYSKRVKHNTFDASGYYGVFFNPPSNDRKWIALITPKGKRKTVYLGSWKSEREAAIAVDRAALHLFGKKYARLNFPDEVDLREAASPAALAKEALDERKRETSSRYVGVSWQKGAWGAAIVANRATVNLGRFDCEEDAAHAYDRAALKYRTRKKAKLNFHPKTKEFMGGMRIADFEALPKK